MHYYQIAVDAPLSTALTYKSETVLKPGQSVIVPLGKRKVNGVIINSTSDAGPHQLKEITSIDESQPVLSAQFLNWLQWLADYYVHPIGQVTSLAFAPLAVAVKKRKSKKTPVVRAYAKSEPMKLTDEQATCFAGISKSESFSVHLLHGVTGSGKTEVYLQLLERVLKQNQSGLVLVPEISLTPQLVERFAARFGDQVAVIHSHLTDRERTEQWWSAVNGEKKILIGARSALFCPIENLGLIIVDEEHEPSYKQDEKLKYHGRDAAIVLAKQMNCPIVLGSATPSLESWAHALSGKYELHQMKSRVSHRSLPTVEVIDMREKTNSSPELPFWLSTPLYNAIVETLEKKQQVALFLNRRGVAQTVMCRDCGFTHRCPNCEITLTLHGERHLVCHYCEYSARKEDYCPQCKEGELAALGMGTEQLEKDMQRIFESAVVARADRDEITSRESLEELIKRMEDNEINILVGTQMIAKGLDFKNLTLVGLVLADVGFNLPDFRSTERSFQLLTQVSGRSGRHFDDGGRVIIQTYNTEYPAIDFSKTADFEGFAKIELELRKELLYPPYGRLTSIRIMGSDLKNVERTAQICAERARQLKSRTDQKSSAAYAEIQVLGPAPSPLFKIRNQYRYHLLLKAPPTGVLSSFCRQLLGDLKWASTGTKVQVDIDPIHLL
jgi:primosomal protein N' (replication factor Y)